MSKVLYNHRLSVGLTDKMNGLLEDLATHTEDFPHREKVFGIVKTITHSVDRCSRVTRRPSRSAPRRVAPRRIFTPASTSERSIQRASRCSSNW